jgi:glycosyltransferase involved in cell wall biosynthesis
MVPEKGCDVFVGAARFVLPHHPNVKFICVGSGYMRDKYLDDSRFLGVHDKFYFPGYIDDRTLHALMRVADAVVVPSRYEPFGIVALEAMAARTPVVVSDTGGLSEVVEHDRDGLKVWPGHSESLAWGINRVLGDHGHSQWLVSNAFEKAKTVFNWKMIAGKTNEVYTRVLSEYHVNRWKPKIPIDMSSHS